MIKYKILSGFKINSIVLGVDSYFTRNQIRSIIDLQGVSHIHNILDLWSASELNTKLGIYEVIDDSYDTTRYDKTSEPIEVLNVDGDPCLDYTTAITEKVNYLDILKVIKKQELSDAFDSKINEGYNYVGNGENFTLKSDFTSVTSFAFTSENIVKGNTHTHKIKDLGGNIHNAVALSTITDAFDLVKDHYLECLDKKFEHEDTINGSDVPTLEAMTTFDFTLI